MIRDRIDRWLDGWSPWRLRRRLADMLDAYSALNASLEDAEIAVTDARADADVWRRVATASNHVTFDLGDMAVYEGEPWTPDTQEER